MLSNKKIKMFFWVLMGSAQLLLAASGGLMERQRLAEQKHVNRVSLGKDIQKPKAKQSQAITKYHEPVQLTTATLPSAVSLTSSDTSSSHSLQKQDSISSKSEQTPKKAQEQTDAHFIQEILSSGSVAEMPEDEKVNLKEFIHDIVSQEKLEHIGYLAQKVNAIDEAHISPQDEKTIEEFIKAILSQSSSSTYGNMQALLQNYATKIADKSLAWLIGEKHQTTLTRNQLLKDREKNKTILEIYAKKIELLDAEIQKKEAVKKAQSWTDLFFDYVKWLTYASKPDPQYVELD